VLPRAPHGQALSLLFFQGFLRARALLERLLVEDILLKPRICLDRCQHLRLLCLRRLLCLLCLLHLLCELRLLCQLRLFRLLCLLCELRQLFLFCELRLLCQFRLIRLLAPLDFRRRLILQLPTKQPASHQPKA